MNPDESREIRVTRKNSVLKAIFFEAPTEEVASLLDSYGLLKRNPGSSYGWTLHCFIGQYEGALVFIKGYNAAVTRIE